MRRPSIAIVGAGRLGTALAIRLADAGFSISEIVVRASAARRSAARGSAARAESRNVNSARRLAHKVGARLASTRTAQLDADVIWFCVSDAEITRAAAGFSNRDWHEKLALHSSGVLTNDALAPLKKMGARVASVHPLMTFVPGPVPHLRGVSFAIEGDPIATAAAAKIVRALGGAWCRLQKKDKAAYHAFATMVCPLLVSLLASSEEIAALAGMSKREARRRMMPILQQTLQNYINLGPAAAFSGPIVRGDAKTLRLHLRSLGKLPVVKHAYIALARAALEYLPSKNQAELRKLLRQAN